MSIDVQNSWYMSKPLSECENLFSKEEVSEYHAHFYHCECGHKEIVLSSSEETPLYQCEQCDNTCFIDALHVKKGYFALHNTNLNFIYEYKKIDDGYIVNVYLNIPYHADFLRNKLLYKKEFIASLTVSFSKRSHIFKLPRKNFKAIDILKRRIKDFIIEDTGDELIYYKDSLNKIEEIHPFSFNPYLIDAEFSFWKKIDLRVLNTPKRRVGVVEMLYYLLNYRKERSLKRALFEKYTRLLKSSPQPNTFNPLAPFVISRCFDDPNIASKLLVEDLDIFSIEDNSSSFIIEYEDPNVNPYMDEVARGTFINYQIWFIKFLKIHYTENQLAKMLLLRYCDAYSIWHDILSMIKGNKRHIKTDFNKVKLTLENLHDEIVRIFYTRKNNKLNNLHFSYEENYLQACRKIDDIEFRLPSTSKELNTWGESMHNCIFVYANRIKERETTIYGAFRDDKILYAIEASPSLIHEMSGKCNSQVPVEDKNMINQWWEKDLFENRYIQK